MTRSALTIFKKTFEAVEDWAGPLTIALLVLMLALQIVGRTINLGTYLTWTDELARTLFVWCVFLSMPLASKRGTMVYITLSERLWPAFMRPAIKKFAQALWALSALAISALSLLNIIAHYEFPQFTPIMRLNQNWLMLVMPISFFMVFLRSFIDLFKRKA